MKNEYYIDIAYNEALIAKELDEVPIGAVIVKDNRIISTGHNLRITKQNALYHAEIVAIENACKKLNSWRLDGCTLYVTLEPCLMCTGAIQQARISKVVFGALDKKGGAIISRYQIIDDKKLPFKTEYNYLPDTKCSSILSDFFKTKRK